jgi:hypothetical protein
MMLVTDIELDDFKAWFTRDFAYQIPYGETEALPDASCDYVSDADLTKAFTLAIANFNPGLFSTDEQMKSVFFYLAAHFLVDDRKMAIDGLGSTAHYPVSSRSAGPISESYAIPEWILRDPNLGAYATTRYGQKYLALIKPYLIGNAVVYTGATTYR